MSIIGKCGPRLTRALARRRRTQTWRREVWCSVVASQPRVAGRRDGARCRTCANLSTPLDRYARQHRETRDGYLRVEAEARELAMHTGRVHQRASDWLILATSSSWTVTGVHDPLLSILDQANAIARTPPSRSNSSRPPHSPAPTHPVDTVTFNPSAVNISDPPHCTKAARARPT